MSLSSRFAQIRSVAADSTEDEQEEEDEILQRLLGKKNPVMYSSLLMPDTAMDEEDEEIDGSWASDFQSILKSSKEVTPNQPKGITVPSVDSLPATVTVEEKPLPLSPCKVGNVGVIANERGDNKNAATKENTGCSKKVKKLLYSGDGIDIQNSEKPKQKSSNDNGKKCSYSGLDTHEGNTTTPPDNDNDTKQKSSTANPSKPISESSKSLSQMNGHELSEGSVQAVSKLNYKSSPHQEKDSETNPRQIRTTSGNKMMAVNKNKKSPVCTSLNQESGTFESKQNSHANAMLSPLSKHNSRGKNKENEKSCTKRIKNENKKSDTHKVEKESKRNKDSSADNKADKKVLLPRDDKKPASHAKVQHLSAVKDEKNIVHKSKPKKINKDYKESHGKGTCKTSTVSSKQKSTDKVLTKHVEEYITSKDVCVKSSNKVHVVAETKSIEVDNEISLKSEVKEETSDHKIKSPNNPIESVQEHGVIIEKKPTADIYNTKMCLLLSKTSESEPMLTTGKTLDPEASKSLDIKKAKSFNIKPSTSFPLDEILPVKKQIASGDVHTDTKSSDAVKSRHSSEKNHGHPEQGNSDGRSIGHGRYEENQNFNDAEQSYAFVPNRFNDIDSFQAERNFYEMPDQWYKMPRQQNDMRVNNQQQVFHGEQFNPGDKAAPQAETPTSVSHDFQEIMTAMETGDKSLLGLIQGMLNKQIGTNLKALSERTQAQQESDMNISDVAVELYSPTRPSMFASSNQHSNQHQSIGFYTERSDDDLTEAPSSCDNTEKSARERTDKLFHQFVKQCSALVKTSEDKTKLLSLVNLIKTEGGTELTGTGFTPDLEDNEHSNPSTEASSVSCPSQLSGYSPPSFSPNTQMEEKLIFESRTLLKGGVKSRHIPKCFVKRSGKERPQDPRRSVYGEDNQPVCLPLPTFATALWGEEKVRLILCKDWSVTNNQTESATSTTVYVPPTVHKAPISLTPTQNDVNTPVKDEQISIIVSESNCDERFVSSVYGKCSDMYVKSPEKNEHDPVSILDEVLCNTKLELSGVSSFNSKNKTELVDALTGFMKNTDELTKLSFLPKEVKPKTCNSDIKHAVVTDTAKLKDNDSNFQNSIPVLVGYSTSNSSVSDESSCDASSHSHYWTPVPHHTDSICKRKKIIINLKPASVPDKGPNVGIVKPMQSVVKRDQDRSKNCKIVSMDLDSDLEPDESSSFQHNKLEKTKKQFDSKCLTPKTSLKDEFAKEKQKLSEKQTRKIVEKQELMESTEYLRRLQFEGRSDPGNSHHQKHRNYRTSHSPSPAPSVGSKRSSLERPFDNKFRSERSSAEQYKDNFRSNRSSSHSDHRRRSWQETHKQKPEPQSRKRHHTTAVYSGVDNKRGRHIDSSTERQSHRSINSGSEWYRYSYIPKQPKHESKKKDRDTSSERMVEIVGQCYKKERSPDGIGNLNRKQKWFQTEKRPRSPMIDVKSTGFQDNGRCNKLSHSNEFNFQKISMIDKDRASEPRYVSITPKISNAQKSESEMTDEEFVKEYRENFNTSVNSSPVHTESEVIYTAPPIARSAPPKPEQTKESSERLDRDREFLLNYVKKIDTIEHVKHEKVDKIFPSDASASLKREEENSDGLIQNTPVISGNPVQPSDQSSKILKHKPLKSKYNVRSPHGPINMAKKGIIKISPKIGTGLILKTKSSQNSRECLSYNDVLPITEFEDGEIQ